MVNEISIVVIFGKCFLASESLRENFRVETFKGGLCPHPIHIYPGYSPILLNHVYRRHLCTLASRMDAVTTHTPNRRKLPLQSPLHAMSSIVLQEGSVYTAAAKLQNPPAN